MARKHGRFGRMYFAVSDGAEAAPAVALRRWTLNSATDKAETTSQGDNSKTYVAGLPDAQGSYEGFYDGDSAQAWAASQDGLARKMYLYPDTSDTDTYAFGTAFLDFSIDSPVDGATTINGSFNAATPFSSVGNF